MNWYNFGYIFLHSTYETIINNKIKKKTLIQNKNKLLNYFLLI